MSDPVMIFACVCLALLSVTAIALHTMVVTARAATQPLRYF